MISNKSLLRFAKTLSSQYSNSKQSNKNPKNYAHINIYFIPVEWNLLKGPGFYSEQSYDYDPWKPYRQAIHRLYINENYFVLENYKIENQERFAGAGIYPKLLKEIDPKKLILRKGCSMKFKTSNDKDYFGKIEPGNCCFVMRNKLKTYLVSEVKFTNKSWESIDQGFDTRTNKLIWGPEHGRLIFDRIKKLGDHLNEKWTLNSSNSNKLIG